MGENPAPKRRHVIHITIGGDTWEDVLQAVRQIEFDLATHDPADIRIYSGSPNSGYSVSSEFYPEQTHDRYFDEVSAYLDARKKEGSEG